MALEQLTAFELASLLSPTALVEAHHNCMLAYYQAPASEAHEIGEKLSAIRERLIMRDMWREAGVARPKRSKRIANA